MSSFDPLHRASKRRKIKSSSTSDPAATPIYTNSINAVKQTLHGDRSSSKANETDAGGYLRWEQDLQDGPEKDLRDERSEAEEVGGELSLDLALKITYPRKETSSQDVGMITRRKSGHKKGVRDEARVPIKQEDHVEGEPAFAPPKEKRKKYKGWVYLDELPDEESPALALQLNDKPEGGPAVRQPQIRNHVEKSFAEGRTKIHTEPEKRKKQHASTHEEEDRDVYDIGNLGSDLGNPSRHRKLGSPSAGKKAEMRKSHIITLKYPTRRKDLEGAVAAADEDEAYHSDDVGSQESPTLVHTSGEVSERAEEEILERGVVSEIPTSGLRVWREKVALAAEEEMLEPGVVSGTPTSKIGEWRDKVPLVAEEEIVEPDIVSGTPISKAGEGGDKTPSVQEASSAEDADADVSDSQLVMGPNDDGSWKRHANFLRYIFKQDPKARDILKTHLLEGLTGKRRLPLVNLEIEQQKVHQLLEQTILAGEGNSMLITGSRATGKTTLVETVIADLGLNYRDDFHVVRLNGFIHTDDKLALREIWRQLGREMEVEDNELGGRSNYADTLSSLLALLAHSARAPEEDMDVTGKAVIFILDEFDLFASHPRQTLLYNLFDVAQSRNAPIAVLGLTTKVNVVDSLEKRVKSRFGQRYVHLSLPKTFSAFQAICLSALQYHPSPHAVLTSRSLNLKNLSQRWNAHIDLLAADGTFTHFLRSIYSTTKSTPTFLSACLLPVSLLSSTDPLLTPSSFTSTNSNTLTPPDNKLALLPSLSTLALSLLIAAARLNVILTTDLCSFAMAYEEYVALASESKLQAGAAGQVAVGGGARVWSVDVAKGAWERLVALELVVSAVPGGGGAARGFGGNARGRSEMCRVDVGMEEIGKVIERDSGVVGRAVLGKWCREI